MKYSIYINQKELSKTDLDLVDAAILDYLYFICNSRNEKIKKQRFRGYTWVDYSQLLKNNPLLKIKSKGALTARVQKILKAGFIKLLEKRKNGHKLLYFQMTEKVDTLFISMNNPIHDNENTIYFEKKPIHINENPIHENEPISTIKDNTINNYAIKIKRASSFYKPTIEDVISFCIERKNNIDPENFYDFYESKNWMIGKTKMKDWQACIRTWERRENGSNKKLSNVKKHLKSQRGAELLLEQYQKNRRND
ncbi:MAG: hypothetical protein H8E55_05100 [Pelagibacterales bacterium]|nr:hypothetical protein [Pelagibacterales bacterium]